MLNVTSRSKSDCNLVRGKLTGLSTYYTKKGGLGANFFLILFSLTNINIISILFLVLLL